MKETGEVDMQGGFVRKVTSNAGKRLLRKKATTGRKYNSFNNSGAVALRAAKTVIIRTGTRGGVFVLTAEPSYRPQAGGLKFQMTANMSVTLQCGGEH